MLRLHARRKEKDKEREGDTNPADSFQQASSDLDYLAPRKKKKKKREERKRKRERRLKKRFKKIRYVNNYPYTSRVNVNCYRYPFIMRVMHFLIG